MPSQPKGGESPPQLPQRKHLMQTEIIIAKTLWTIACNFAPALGLGVLGLGYLWFTEKR